MRAPLNMQAREPIFVSVRPRRHSCCFTVPLAVGPGSQGGCAAANSPLGSGPLSPPSAGGRVLFPTSCVYEPSGVPSCSLERKRETGDTQDSEAWSQGLAVCLEALRGWQGRRVQRACPPPTQRVPPPTTGAQLPPMSGISLGHHGQARSRRVWTKGKAKGGRGALSPPVWTRWDGMLLRREDHQADGDESRSETSGFKCSLQEVIGWGQNQLRFGPSGFYSDSVKFLVIWEVSHPSSFHI